MQETRNNCFGSKKRSTTLLQAKTGKHECRNVTATYMHCMVLLPKVLFNHDSAFVTSLKNYRLMTYFKCIIMNLEHRKHTETLQKNQAFYEECLSRIQVF